MPWVVWIRRRLRSPVLFSPHNTQRRTPSQEARNVVHPHWQWTELQSVFSQVIIIIIMEETEAGHQWPLYPRNTFGIIIIMRLHIWSLNSNPVCRSQNPKPGPKRADMLAKCTERAMRTTYRYSTDRSTAAGDTTANNDAPDRRGCRYCSHKRQVVQHLLRTDDLVAITRVCIRSAFLQDKQYHTYCIQNNMIIMQEHGNWYSTWPWLTVSYSCYSKKVYWQRQHPGRFLPRCIKILAPAHVRGNAFGRTSVSAVCLFVGLML